MFAWIRDNAIVVLGIVAAIVFVALVILILRVLKKSKARKEERAIMAAEIPITDAEEDADFSAPARVREKGTSELSWLKPLPLKEETEKETEDPAENVGAFDNEKEIKEMAKEKTKEKEEKTAKKAVKAKETAKAEKTKTSAKKKEEPKEKETKTVKKTEPAENAKEPKKVIGKWIVKEKGEDEYVAYLYANNGEVILTSEIYSSADGAKKGVQTIKKNIANENFQIYCDKNGQYYFKLKTSGNRFLCVGETYPTENACLSAVESVKRFSDAPVQEEVEKDLTFLKYEPSDTAEDAKAKSGYAGKWVIDRVDNMYMAKLFASNGELLLCSESYTLENSAKTAVTVIRSNGLAGNFIIDKDKKGRYFFKLRNAQKTTLCVGETYSQLMACQSAIDSVRRFLKTAKLVGDEATK